MPFYVYITANKSHRVLYTGVTSDLKRRIAQHKAKEFDGFTKRYNVDKLVYYEAFVHAKTAIAREKQMKGGSRQKKIDLIEAKNGKWEDLTTKL